MLARRADFDAGVSPSLVRSLRDRIDQLEKENRQFREAAEATFPFPAEWRLTRIEARFLSALMRARSGWMSSERLLTAIYGLEPDVEPKIIDVWVCKLRKKLALAGTGVEITTLRGEGFGLTAAHRDRLRAILDDAPDASRRSECDVQAAVEEATAPLLANLEALAQENRRLQAALAAHDQPRPAVKSEPRWKRWAKAEGQAGPTRPLPSRRRG